MERLDGSVRRALRAADVPDAGVLAEVTRAWPDAVGPAIARSAWPQRIARDGTLHVTAVSSTWAFELGRMVEAIQAKLRSQIGDATPAEAGPVEQAPRERPVPSPSEEAEAASVSAGIGDPDLREAVRRAVAASLAAARDDRPV